MSNFFPDNAFDPLFGPLIESHPMGSPAIPCGQCGTPIVEADLESGAAIHLKGRSFCGACKADAAKAFSIEDLTSTKSASAGKPPAPPAPPVKKKPPAAPPGPPEPSRLQTRRRPSLPSASPRHPLTLPLLGGLGAAAAVGGLIFFIVGSRNPDPPRGAATNPAPVPAAQPDPALSPAEQARQLFKQVETLARNADIPPDEILARLDKMLPALKGTEYAAKAADFRQAIQKERDAARGALELEPVIAELKKNVAADPEFRNFPALRDQFQKARDLAARSAPARTPEIQRLQSDYNTRYEKAAEPYYAEIHEAATVYADERRYADALKKIETFPAHLRHSGTWKGLAQLKADVEKRAKILPPKK